MFLSTISVTRKRCHYVTSRCPRENSGHPVQTAKENLSQKGDLRLGSFLFTWCQGWPPFPETLALPKIERRNWVLTEPSFWRHSKINSWHTVWRSGFSLLHRSSVGPCPPDYHLPLKTRVILFNRISVWPVWPSLPIESTWIHHRIPGSLDLEKFIKVPKKMAINKH